jgi:hypothetical protein
MLKLFVRIGVAAAVTVLAIYLFLRFATSDQSAHPAADVKTETTAGVKIETTVREIAIASPGETADVDWVSPYESKRWVVVFDVDRVLRGRFAKREIRFLVHSPSLNLDVREKGQHVVLERQAGAWDRSDNFFKY